MMLSFALSLQRFNEDECTANNGKRDNNFGNHIHDFTPYKG
jgi:hypothetical protein